MRKDISLALKETAPNLNVTIPAYFLLTRTELLDHTFLHG